MFEDVSALLHTQDHAAALIGQELAHVNVLNNAKLSDDGPACPKTLS